MTERKEEATAVVILARSLRQMWGTADSPQQRTRRGHVPSIMKTG
jgi:hypothetical protein